MKFVGKFNVVDNMSKKNAPVYRAKAGEIFEFNIPSSGNVKSTFTEINKTGKFPKPHISVVGPIIIGSCKRGNTIKITIEDINMKKSGKVWTGSWASFLKEDVMQGIYKDVDIIRKEIFYEDDIKKVAHKGKLRPVITTIGVAPADDNTNWLVPNLYGGNINANQLGIGSSIYLEAQVDEGYIYIGDVYASMGNGKILGSGVEAECMVAIKIEILEEQKVKIPVIENSENYTILASDENIENAFKSIIKSAIFTIMKSNSISFIDAYCLVGEFCDLGVAQIVNPKKTVTLTIPKNLLKKPLFNI